MKVGMGAALTRQSSHPISPVAALHPPPLPPMPSSPARVDMPASVGASAGRETGDLLIQIILIHLAFVKYNAKDA